MRTIKTKLIIGYLLVLLISIYIFAGYFYIRVQTNLYRTSRHFLKDMLNESVQYLQMKEDFNINETANYLSKKTATGNGPYRIFFAIFDAEAQVLAKTQEFLDQIDQVQILLKQEDEEEIFSVNDLVAINYLLLVTKKIRNRNHELFILQFALDSPHDERMLKSLRNIMFFAVPLVTMLAFTGGLFLTHRVMSPLVKITKSAKQLSVKQLQNRLPLSGADDELDELAKTINAIFDQMQEAYDRLNQFASDASHELRLPLTAIKGEAEVVLERERSIEEYQKTLESMIEEMERMEKMLNSLLLLTRLDDNADLIDRQDVDITQLLRNIIDFYDILAHEKDISCQLIAAKPIYMKGDPTSLTQLFSNLIENAIKYTPHNGMIRIACELKNNHCIVTVYDNGIGIAKEHHQRIFDRFYRVDKGRARALGGTGLGLSICQHIVQSHRGTIRVESEIGKGSRFIVQFPQ